MVTFDGSGSFVVKHLISIAYAGVVDLDSVMKKIVTKLLFCRINVIGLPLRHPIVPVIDPRAGYSVRPVP